MKCSGFINVETLFNMFKFGKFVVVKQNIIFIQSVASIFLTDEEDHMVHKSFARLH
jgi:hypothetical protein